jgi:hypothetical protein
MAVPFNLQTYVKPVPVLAFRTTEPPVQKLVEDAAVMLAVGGVLTVTTVAKEVAEQALALVTVTE